MNNHRNVYISGPITGIDNYKENFHAASKLIASQGYIPIDPCCLPHDHDESYSSYMKEDIRALLDCDYIYMLPGWKKSDGAMCEKSIAVACKIPEYYPLSVVYLDSFK
jgi:hypothetical protein